MIGEREREAHKRVELRSRRWQFRRKKDDVKVKDERTGGAISTLLKCEMGRNEKK